jgi:hypothetical protein
MKRNLFVSAACLGWIVVSPLNAAISVGPTGAGPITFDTTPAITEFATAVLLGTASTFSDVAGLDAAVAALDVTAIPGLKMLSTSGTEPPSVFSGGFRRHTTRNALVSRPATDGTNAANLLLATLQNDSGGNQPSFVLSYDFAVQSPIALQLPGFHVYSSLTGAPGSWLPIPGLTGSETPGNLSAIMSLGSWPPGHLLYLVWVDDNGNGGPDPSYTIDNLAISFCLAPLLIVQQPVTTNIVQDGTVGLEVVARGGCGGEIIGASYQWYKVGVGPLDPADNPTVTTATLVISNAQFSHSGDYFVVVSDFGSQATSTTAHIEILADNDPPTFLTASAVPPGLFAFRLTVDEPLCVDPDPIAGCGSDATLPWHWQIVNASNPSDDLGVALVTVNGPTIEFTTENPRTPNQSYRIVASSLDLSDRHGNVVPFGTFASTFPTISFTQRAAGYTGTQDTELHSGELAGTPLGAAITVKADAEDAGVAQGLLRFDNIFGVRSDQIAPNARILSASLALNQFDAGNPVNLHRMLGPWDQGNVTWNSFGNGVQTNGIEARAVIDAVLPTQSTNIDVLTSLQAWANGEANFGWALISTGSDGYQFTSSESANPPSLTVVYDPVIVDNCETNILQQPTPYTRVAEGQPFTLSVVVASTGLPPLFQWTRDNLDIPGATDSSYHVERARSCAGYLGDVGTYRVRLTCGPVSILSEPAVVLVGSDVIPPRLTSAVARPGGTEVALTFSKRMSTNDALDVFHYVFDPTLAITGVSLSNELSSATVIVTTDPRQPGVAYSLQIFDLIDDQACPSYLSPNPTVVTLTGASVVSPWAAAWRYHTNNLDATLGAIPWFAADFDDSTWLTGQGLFGFENTVTTLAALPAPIATPLVPNSDSDNPNRVTTYFRRQLTLPELPSGSTFALCHFIDDGAIFYLDGAEIGRVAMTNPPPTLFLQRASQSGEATLQTFLFDANPGGHTLAAEVHQGGVVSGDVLFGAEVRVITLPAQLTISHGDTGAVTVRWTADSSWQLFGAGDVAGPYHPIAGSQFGSLLLLPAAVTNQFFYQLRYTGQP